MTAITSKQRAIELAEPRFQEKCKPIIAAIEAKIATWNGKTKIVVGRPRDWDYTAMQHVINRYKSQGWDARYVSSQFDGDCIELS